MSNDQRDSVQTLAVAISSEGRIVKKSWLLDRAADLREDVARIRSDQPDGAEYNDKNDRQHHRIFCNILPALIRPKIA
jgi:hypothetical protein